MFPLTSNYPSRRHGSDGNKIITVTDWRYATFYSARLSARAKSTALQVSMFMGTDDGCTFVSQMTIAHYAKVSTKTVARGMTELRRRGYLRSRRISRRPEPGFRYVHYAALPGDRDQLPPPADPFLERGF